MALSKEEFQEWRGLHATKEILRVVEAKREELRQLWEGGSFTDYTLEGTTLVNVGNVGTCKGYAFVTELTYEDYIAELDDGESKRISPPGGSGTGEEV